MRYRMQDKPVRMPTKTAKHSKFNREKQQSRRENRWHNYKSFSTSHTHLFPQSGPYPALSGEKELIFFPTFFGFCSMNSLRTPVPLAARHTSRLRWKKSWIHDKTGNFHVEKIVHFSRAKDPDVPNLSRNTLKKVSSQNKSLKSPETAICTPNWVKTHEENHAFHDVFEILDDFPHL